MTAASDKTQDQLDFEAKVQSAARSFSAYDTEMQEMIDLVAIDMYSGGDVEGYSKLDKRYWRDLPAVPPYTRGETTYPAKLQWRIKAARAVDIIAAFKPRMTPAQLAIENRKAN